MKNFMIILRIIIAIIGLIPSCILIYLAILPFVILILLFGGMFFIYNLLIQNEEEIKDSVHFMMFPFFGIAMPFIFWWDFINGKECTLFN